MKDTESLGYGIVEFREPKDAEKMWQQFQKHKINDTEISLTFCIPGRHAVSIYNRIMWKVVSQLLDVMCFSLFLKTKINYEKIEY